MVEIFLSKKYNNYFYIRYSISTNSKEDDAHFSLFSKFAKQRKSFYMIIEMCDGTSITDRRWFEVSSVAGSPVFKSLKKAVGFGFKGIQLNFMRKYFKILHEVGIETELLDTQKDFEIKYKLDFKKDFYRAFSYSCPID